MSVDLRTTAVAAHAASPLTATPVAEVPRRGRPGGRTEACAGAALRRLAAGGRAAHAGRGRRARRGPAAVRRPGRGPSAPGAAHRVSIPARRRRSRRGRAGRVRQGVQPHHVVSRGVAVRGLVHADSHQRLSRSPESARPARTVAGPRSTRTTPATIAAPSRGAWPPGGDRTLKRACSRGNGGRA